MKSERMERLGSYNYSKSDEELYEEDDKLCERIRLFLNHSKIDKYCLVDAYYYDFSGLPEHLKGKFYRDMYFLYGITNDAEVITKWVERWDLDSDKSIVNGEVK